MELKNFQLSAVRSLFAAMEAPARDIILKSPTGSGKTILLTYFMQQYLQSYPKTVFIWLTPGKGGLEEQSKAKMDQYIPSSQTKLLSDVMTTGFEENDSCFLNWEKLTKKGNNALKDSEHTNFLEHIRRAQDAGVHFIVIIDESHQNNTIKADDLLRYFHPQKIIRCSATPKPLPRTTWIEIPEQEVIASGLIKKLLLINPGFPQVVEVEDQTNYLLARALEKRQELRAEYVRRGIAVNPLLIVQLPNRSAAVLSDVERWFSTQGLRYDNGRLAIWLSDRHENLDRIELPDAASEAVIIKQAVATGWDCPRAQILLKLRENMDETFEIQTIGRIRRMPEAKHYGSDMLDSCYLYTFDEKFTAGVRQGLGSAALDACTLFLKPEYRSVTLPCEQRSMPSSGRNPQRVLHMLSDYFAATYRTTDNLAENQIRLEAAGFLFRDAVVRYTRSGETATLDFDPNALNQIAVSEPLSTHKHGRDYHRQVSRLGLEIGMEYSYMNTILRRLFDAGCPCRQKLLALPSREIYAFVLNNTERLRRAVCEALSAELAQVHLDLPAVSETVFRLPHSCLFTYQRSGKRQVEYRKNVYSGYLSSAAPRSTSEVKFEKFCERTEGVDWWYKNGGKGSEYLSIVYLDNTGHQRLFYPDYVVCVRGALWILETKGGFDRSGGSQDIDPFTAKKFDVLHAFLEKHGLHGGLVRNDGATDELCICTERYSEDISGADWRLLEDVLI